MLRSEQTGGRAGVIGNVDYMSPEQVRGAAVDERGDVYQAGAVLYFALTGRPPFARSTPAETMRAHLETPPPVPSVMDSRIPRRLDRLVVRAILKDPADRFASAAEMRAALAAAASSGGLGDRRSGEAACDRSRERRAAGRRERDAGARRQHEGAEPVAGGVHTRWCTGQGRRGRRSRGAGAAGSGAWIVGSSGRGHRRGDHRVRGGECAGRCRSRPRLHPTEPAAQPSPPPPDEPTPSSAPVWTPAEVADVVVPHVASSTLADAMRATRRCGARGRRARRRRLGASGRHGARIIAGGGRTHRRGRRRRRSRSHRDSTGSRDVVGLSRAEALVRAAACRVHGRDRARAPTAGVAAGTIVGHRPGGRCLAGVGDDRHAARSGAAPSRHPAAHRHAHAHPRTGGRRWLRPSVATLGPAVLRMSYTGRSPFEASVEPRAGAPVATTRSSALSPRSQMSSSSYEVGAIVSDDRDARRDHDDGDLRRRGTAVASDRRRRGR